MKVVEVLKQEDHRKALYATLVFIMLMILFFLLVSLEEPDPPLEEKIIEVAIPNIEVEGSQPEGGSSSSEEVSTPETQSTVQESAPDVETQEEESVSVPSGQGNSGDNQEEVAEPQPDTDFTFSGSGGSGGGTGSGFGQGTGVGGNGTGNSPGNGSADLKRKVVKAPVFNANVQEEGIVALDIWVDENGNVIITNYRETGSTTGSEYLIGLAKKAAKTMKYQSKPGTVKEYVGYARFEFFKT